MQRLLIFFLFVCLAVTAGAEEPARAFLDGLRARRYHDVAMEYLDQMESSRLAPAELKAAILYEKSLLLIDSSRQQRDPAVRSRQLNQSQQWLQRFIQEQPESPKVNAARSQLGSLIVERARMTYEQSKKDRNPALEKQALALYEQAFNVFADLQAKVDEKLQTIPKVLNTRDRKEAQLIAVRKQLRADFLETELFAAAIREELADILPAGSSEQTKVLLEAANMYDGIYKNYRTRLAGRYARMYQGRCFQRLGRTKEALGYFGELLDQPNEPETLMTLKAETMVMAMETWLSPSQKKYMEAIKRATRWFDETPAEKQRDADWIAIRYHLARAYKMRADDAKRTEPVDRNLITQSLKSAKEELRTVANESGEYQELAQELLTQLGGPNVIKEDLQPQTFMAAQKLGKEALDAIGPASKRVAGLQSQIQAATDASAKDDLAGQLTAAQQQLVKAQEDAIHYYRLSLQLADDETPRSNVNLVQYFLCYVYFIKQDYFDAAMVGEFVARRYPTSPGAKQSAKIALACYLKLLEQYDDRDVSFEISRLDSVGQYIADTWPQDPETVQSITTLIPHLINAGRLIRAADFVRRLPETSPSRGEYEFVTGQSIWGAIRSKQQELQKLTADGEPATAAERRQEIEQLNTVARELLVAGYGRLSDEPVISESSATAMLSLAQLHVEDRQYDKAIAVLEHDTLGPLTLVNEKSSAAAKPVFVEETYRTALQAYVASMGSAEVGMMDKAKEIIAAMQTALGDDEAGKQRMLSVYVGLAQDVQRQMRSAAPDVKLQLSSVFEAFLLELSTGSSDLNVLSWVSETFANLAAEFVTDGTVNDTARKFYRQADTAFEKLLTQPAISTQMVTQAKIRQADVKFQLDDYDAAFKLYEQVLTANPNAINVQVSAARMLQVWGRTDATRLEQAVNGVTSAGGKPIIWGWAKISLAAVEHEQFRDIFYESRYETANCQLLMSLAGGTDKQKLLNRAARDLSKTATLYPAMGDWKSKYDALQQQIQKTQGN